MPQGCDPSQEAQGRAGCWGFQPPAAPPPPAPTPCPVALRSQAQLCWLSALPPKLAPLQSWGEQIRGGCSEKHSRAVGPQDSVSLRSLYFLIWNMEPLIPPWPVSQGRHVASAH